MKKILILPAVSLCLNFAQASDIEDESISIESQRVFIQANPSDLNKEFVSLYKDVNGCEDDYLRCNICVCRFFGNTSETISKLCIFASTAIISVAAIPNITDEATKTVLIASSAVLQVSSIALLSFKMYSQKAIENREGQLKDVLEKHGVIFPDNDV